MQAYSLYIVHERSSARVDQFEAADDEEALLLTTIRLQRRSMELRCDGRLIATMTKDGTVARADVDRAVIEIMSQAGTLVDGLPKL